MPSPPPANLFPSSLDTSFAAYRIGAALRAGWPDGALVEGGDATFDLDGFAGAGHCTRTPCDLHLQIGTRWNAPAETEGFSFAYLKELCLAAVLRWMKLEPPDGLHPLLHAQLAVLRAQMRSEQDGTVPAQAKTKAGGQGGVQELLAVLQQALSMHGKDEG